MYERSCLTSFSPEAIAERFAEAEVSRLLRIRMEQGDSSFAEHVGYTSLSYASLAKHADYFISIPAQQALTAITPMIEQITQSPKLSEHLIIGLQKKMQEQLSSPKQR